MLELGWRFAGLPASMRRKLEAVKPDGGVPPAIRCRFELGHTARAGVFFIVRRTAGASPLPLACRQRSTRSNKIYDFVRNVRPTRAPLRGTLPASLCFLAGTRPSKKRIALYFVATATKLLRRASQTSHLYLKAENIFFDSPTAGHLPCRFHFFLASSRRFVYNIPRLGRVLPSRRPFTSVFVCLSGVARRRCNTQEARVA